MKQTFVSKCVITGDPFFSGAKCSLFVCICLRGRKVEHYGNQFYRKYKHAIVSLNWFKSESLVFLVFFVFAHLHFTSMWNWVIGFNMMSATLCSYNTFDSSGKTVHKFLECLWELFFILLEAHLWGQTLISVERPPVSAIIHPKDSLLNFCFFSNVLWISYSSVTSSQFTCDVHYRVPPLLKRSKIVLLF